MSSFVKNPGDISSPVPKPTMVSGWDKSRFVTALANNGIFAVKTDPNGEVWFQGVAQAVQDDLCTFEAFVAAYDDPMKSWRDVLASVQTELSVEDAQQSFEQKPGIIFSEEDAW